MREDVPLPAFHALVPIEATNAAALGCLNRLAIHNDHRWTLASTSLLSRLLVDRSMEAGPDAGVLPSSEVVIHGAPSWEFSGQETPLAAGAQQVENRIHYGAKIGCARASTSACCRQKWRNQHPGFISHVRRIGCAWRPPVSRTLL